MGFYEFKFYDTFHFSFLQWILNRNCGVFRAFVVQGGVMLLEKCGQAAAVAVLAVVPHEVPARRIRV